MPGSGSPADEVPSADVLYLHWRRSVWVINMWHQALRKTPELLPITDYGWEHSDINNVRTTEAGFLYQRL